jgi:hypothetical protein
MQNFDKIYLSKIDALTVGENLYAKLKEVLRTSLPIVLKISVVGFILLILQGLIVGLSDRFGVSPKLSFLISSLFYVSAFATFLLIGSLIERRSVVISNEPICKILIIRKKGVQKI